MPAVKLEVLHEVCIHCGLCVMQGYAFNQEGKKVIKPDLPEEEKPLAEGCCPVGAIVQVEEGK